MSQPTRLGANVRSTSSCPFLSHSQPSKDRSIEELITEIVHKKLHQPSLDVSPWIRSLRQNLITCESALRRLRPQKLQQLYLPLLLEQELEEYCDKPIKKSKSKQKIEAQAATKPVLRASVPVAFGLDESQRTLVKNSWNALATSHETGVGSPLHQFFVYVSGSLFADDFPFRPDRPVFVISYQDVHFALLGQYLGHSPFFRRTVVILGRVAGLVPEKRRVGPAALAT
jgi:hypothetical protein